MMPVSEIKTWLDTLPPGASVGVDEGGLAITTPDGENYLEIGGIPEDEPECECVQVDVDLFESRDCPAHGPHSEAARRQREQEAADEAEAARRIPFFLGEVWE